MKEQLEAIRKAALEAITGTQERSELDAVRVQYLGKKGELTAVLKQMGKLSPEERPVMGQVANEVRADLEQAIEAQAAVLAEKALIDRLAADPARAKAGITGVEIAAKIIKECRPYCQGVHIMALGWESKVPEVLKMAGIN